MAQRSVSSFKTTKDSRFADNSTGQIEEVDHRDTFEDVADSFLNKTDHLIDDDTFATATSSNVASAESTKAYVDSGGANGIRTATVSISSAEILALNTTPKEIIAAPGAGKYIQILWGHIFLDFGGTAYSNETTEIEYSTGQDIVGTITSLLNVGVDTIRNIVGSTGGIYAFSQVNNASVRYRATSANPTTGNGTIQIVLAYRIVTI